MTWFNGFWWSKIYNRAPSPEILLNAHPAELYETRVASGDNNFWFVKRKLRIILKSTISFHILFLQNLKQYFTSTDILTYVAVRIL